MRLILTAASGLALGAGMAFAQTPFDPATARETACAPRSDEPPGSAQQAPFLEADLTGCAPDAGLSDPTLAREEAAAASASAIVAASLAEADRRLATMKFETGPPPRNMTKGRTPSP